MEPNKNIQSDLKYRGEDGEKLPQTEEIQESLEKGSVQSVPILEKEGVQAETVGWEEKKGKIAQSILGALEYRGFYDCGKYLDEDIIKSLEPYFKSERLLAQKELLAAVLGKKYLDAIENEEIISVEDIKNLGKERGIL